MRTAVAHVAVQDTVCTVIRIKKFCLLMFHDFWGDEIVYSNKVLEPLGRQMGRAFHRSLMLMKELGPKISKRGQPILDALAKALSTVKQCYSWPSIIQSFDVTVLLVVCKDGWQASWMLTNVGSYNPGRN